MTKLALGTYASEAAYRQHLKTEHFLKYKQGTLHMVKSLRLPTMLPLNPKTMDIIFKKCAGRAISGLPLASIINKNLKEK